MRLVNAPTIVAAVSVWIGIGFVAIYANSAARGAVSADVQAQSAALFTQMAPVLQSPRCMNCHTSTDFPRQGDDRHRLIMSVMRGPDDHGVPALQCQTCHQETNSAATGVPGVPDWHLAPLSMSWEGLSVGGLCRVILDPEKGALGPDQFIPHLETELVQWAWSPGNDLNGRPRTPPPIPRDQFMALAKQWIASGASCPN